MPVPTLRVQNVNDAPLRRDGQYVLYWMISNRRTRFNFALERAVEWAAHLGRPLVVLEALRCGYRWASDRLHAFALQGMADNRRRFAQARIAYYPYVETAEGQGHGLLEALAADACVVVTDDYPAFFLPRMVAAAGRKLPVRLEKVDSNGLLPLRATDRVFTTAFSFRAFLQKNIAPHLEVRPLSDPLTAYAFPREVHWRPEIETQWPQASEALLRADPSALRALPIDHTVPPVSTLTGGTTAAEALLDTFIQRRLTQYLDRNEPDADAASGLSSHLHWGHLSVHQVFERVMQVEHWSPDRLQGPVGGSREGFWKMSPPAESFLDELVTWREIGFNMCHLRPDDYDSYDSLPDWALASLEKHAADPRPRLYTLEQLEAARTSDPIWNAAQNQLRTDGIIHNYLRMLWAKRVLEWTDHPRRAYEILEHLNNKWALDGRDPNSYSGILWTFGRYDRAWGPERPIYGLIRYMSSDNTARKLSLQRYLRRYGGQPTLL